MEMEGWQLGGGRYLAIDVLAHEHAYSITVWIRYGFVEVARTLAHNSKRTA